MLRDCCIPADAEAKNQSQYPYYKHVVWIEWVGCWLVGNGKIGKLLNHSHNMAMK